MLVPSAHTVPASASTSKHLTSPVLALTRDVVPALGVAALGHADLGHLLPCQGAILQLVVVHPGRGVLPLHIEGVLSLIRHPGSAKHGKI